MSACTERPWSPHSRAGDPAESTVEHDTARRILRDAVRRAPERPLPPSFDAPPTVGEVDEPTGPQQT